MFKKLFLAAALIALPLMLTQEKASAFGGIGYGMHGYGMHGYGHGIHPRPLPISPHRSVHRSYSRAVVPHASYRHGYGAGYGYGSYGRSCGPHGYGGYGVGHGVGYGGAHYGRPGFSLRIGY